MKDALSQVNMDKDLIGRKEMRSFLGWAGTILGSLAIVGVIWLFALLPSWTWRIGVIIGLAPASIVIFVAGYYLRIGLARNNIFWTIVDDGWCKIAMCFGKFDRILPPGFHWLGIPWRDTLYSRTMKFLKAVAKEDGTVEVEGHDDKKIHSFKTTEYPYAIPFKDEEDYQGVPLNGVGVLMAYMEDARKAFFVASDWYAIMNMMAMPCLRDTITAVSYEEIIGRNPDDPTAKKKAKETFSQLWWNTLKNPRDGGLPSVVEDLRVRYGIVVISARVASIDPREDLREITLEPYKADKEAEAAHFRLDATATKASVLSKMMDIEINKRIEASRPAPDQPPTLTRQQVEKQLIDDGQMAALRTQHLEALKLYEADSFQVIEDRTVLQGPDGKPLSDVNNIVAAALAILKRWKGQGGNNPSGRKKNPGGGGKNKGGDPDQPSVDDIRKSFGK